MMPNQAEVEVPLLKCLVELGGHARPPQIYDLIRKYFPTMTEADLTEQLRSGGNKWTNRVQWTRQALVARGEMASPSYGVWAITEKGHRRTVAEEPTSSTAQAVGLSTNLQTVSIMPQQEFKPADLKETRIAASPINLEELSDDYTAAFRKKVLQKLQDLTPSQFERFAGILLSAYGFMDMKVTGRTNDGGIDGHGKLRVGLAAMNVAFQCKRWQGSVGRPEIDKFRGAIQGEYEQGIFFTTSEFSQQAQDASIKKGAAPVVLLNGDAIVDLMVEKGIGIRRKPVEVYEDQIESVFEERR